MLEEYSKLRPHYESFARRLRDLAEQVIQADGIHPHSITARAKEMDSLRGKLASVDRGYQALTDVTDLCGLRSIGIGPCLYKRGKSTMEGSSYIWTREFSLKD